MNLKTLFRKFDLDNICLDPRWASLEIYFNEDDEGAAWELYPIVA